MYRRASSSLLTKKLTGPSWIDCWPDAKPRLVAPCMVSRVIVGLFATSLSRVPASTPTPTAPPRPRGTSAASIAVARSVARLASVMLSVVASAVSVTGTLSVVPAARSTSSVNETSAVSCPFTGPGFSAISRAA